MLKRAMFRITRFNDFLRAHTLIYNLFQNIFGEQKNSKTNIYIRALFILHKTFKRLHFHDVIKNAYFFTHETESTRYLGQAKHLVIIFLTRN